MANSIDRYLASYVFWRRWVFVLRALAIATLVTICWAVLWCLLDRAFNLSAPARTVALVFVCVIAILIVVRPISFLWRRGDPVAAAFEIESRQPIFDQRLITIASQLSSDSIMLNHLRIDVQSIISQRNGRVAISLQPVLFPLLGMAGSLLTAAAMFLLPQLDFPLLLQRFVKPLAGFPPVTITRLYVQPGSVSITEGRSLTISAAVEPPDQPNVTLHLSDDGQTWTELPMPAKPYTVGTYSTSVAALVHDVRYYVTAGDAATAIYNIAVLRPPGVVEYRIHCEPPSPAHQPPTNVINTDGDFAAPAGSRLSIDIVSTEPLLRGSLLIGRDEIALIATGNPLVRRAKLNLHQDLHYQCRLTALNGITTTSPHASFLQAIKPADTSQRSEVPGFDEQLKLYFQSLDRATTQP